VLPASGNRPADQCGQASTNQLHAGRFSQARRSAQAPALQAEIKGQACGLQAIFSTPLLHDLDSLHRRVRAAIKEAASAGRASPRPDGLALPRCCASCNQARGVFSAARG